MHFPTGMAGDDEWEQAGLLRPSSTWTYLVDDTRFDNDGLRIIMQESGTGSLGVVLWWPLLVAWGFWERWKRRLTGPPRGDRVGPGDR